MSENSIVSKVAYLIGVNEKYFKYYNEKAINQAKNNKTAVFVRLLCVLRSKIMIDYENTKNELIKAVKFRKMSYYWQECNTLRKVYGVNLKCNTVEPLDIIKDINKYIDMNVDRLKVLFPELKKNGVILLEWKYLKQLFVMPISTMIGNSKPNEIELVKSFVPMISSYPYGRYINCKTAKKRGGILQSDSRFIQAILLQHNIALSNGDIRKITNEGRKSVVAPIKSFIKRADNIVIAVDCENCCCYAFYSLLKALGKEELKKISSVMLYNDTNTTSAWNHIDKMINIPVQVVPCKRIIETKSLVDMKMCADITRLHYTKNISEFILCTSDSDFCGLMATIDTANYYVIAESNKVSEKTINSLKKNGIKYSFFDDVIDDNQNEKNFVKCVVDEEIKRQLKNAVDADTLIDRVANSLKIMKRVDISTIRQQVYNSAFSFNRNNGELQVTKNKIA